MNTSPNGERRMVTGLFSNAASAELAYQACVEHGHEIGEVNVVMSEDRRKQFMSDDSKTTTLLASSEAGRNVYCC